MLSIGLFPVVLDHDFVLRGAHGRDEQDAQYPGRAQRRELPGHEARARRFRPPRRTRPVSGTALTARAELSC